MEWTLEVVYESLAGLHRDWVEQLRIGGLFAALTPPPELPPLVELQLLLRVDGVPPIRVAARLSAASADSLCIEVADDARAPLAEAAARLFAAPPEGDRARRSVRLVRAVKDDRVDKEKLPIEQRIELMTVGEKIQLALHGHRDARLLLLRERAGVVQSSLVRNVKITLDEIVQLARTPQLAPDAAEALRDHPTWGMSPQVAAALVRNPRTPLPTAVQLVARLNPSDLRLVGKGTGVRAAVAQAARKRLIER